MAIGIGRRQFISTLGGAAVAWPFAAYAQQAAMQVIGFLSSVSPGPYTQFVAAFRQGLNETGFVEGQNVAIEFRWAEGHYDRLPALATELVRRQVAVIVATGGAVSGLAAKAATATIPIVFTTGIDPVKSGLVASLSRPGGNATGVAMFLSALEGKRLGLLRELVPTAKLIAVLLDPDNPSFDSQLTEVQEAARTVGQELQILHASSESEFDTALAAAVQLRAGALLVTGAPLFNNHRDQLVALAARYAIPAIYEARQYVVDGGLMSYGNDQADAYRQAGIFTGKILKGANPADLPVQRSTKFEFVINLKAAKALGIQVPPGMSARADDVIE